MGGSLPAVAQDVVRVTLDDAISMAVRTSPLVVAAEGDLRVANASRREYFGQWMPSVSSSGSFSTNSTDRFDQATQRTVSGSSRSFSTGLSASYTIFDGFRRNANGRSTSAGLESAEATLVDQRFQVILQTKQAFFNALAGEELVRVADTRIQRAEGQLRIAKDKLAAGGAIRSDTLRSFVELGNARLALLTAQTQRATALANLARLIGVDGGVTVVGNDMTAEVIDIDTAAIREEALTNSPTLEQATSQARSADAQVGVSRAQYFPSLNASYSQNWSGQALGDLSNSWSARVSLSWPLFNGFTREASVARSAAGQEAAWARVEDTRRQVDAQLTQQFASAEAARLRLEIARASRAAAEEDLRVQQERYRLGVATIVDLLTTQVSLDQAEVDIVQARLDFLLAQAAIEALIGREL
jgi:outer membrane protein